MDSCHKHLRPDPDPDLPGLGWILWDNYPETPIYRKVWVGYFGTIYTGTPRYRKVWFGYFGTIIRRLLDIERFGWDTLGQLSGDS